MRKSLIPLLSAFVLSCGCVGDLITETAEEISGGAVFLKNPELAWSASSYEATIGADNSFPLPHQLLWCKRILCFFQYVRSHRRLRRHAHPAQRGHDHHHGLFRGDGQL